MESVTCPSCGGLHGLDVRVCPVYGDPLPTRVVAPPPLDHQPASSEWVDPFGSQIDLVLPSGRVVTLMAGDRLLIGRDSGSPVAAEMGDNISRRHAEIEVDVDGAFVTDLGSANGTYHAGQRLDSGQRTRLTLEEPLVLARAPESRFTIRRSPSA